jgi:hypothetical protein
MRRLRAAFVLQDRPAGGRRISPGKVTAAMENNMSEEQFARLLERVTEAIEKKPRSLIDYIKEWAPIAILAASLIGGYARLQQQQEFTTADVAYLKEHKADKDNLAVSLAAQNDKLSMIYSELVEIRKLSYPPSFTAFAPGTKLQARKH